METNVMTMPKKGVAPAFNNYAQLWDVEEQNSVLDGKTITKEELIGRELVVLDWITIKSNQYFDEKDGVSVPRSYRIIQVGLPMEDGTVEKRTFTSGDKGINSQLDKFELDHQVTHGLYAKYGLKLSEYKTQNGTGKTFWFSSRNN